MRRVTNEDVFAAVVPEGLQEIAYGNNSDVRLLLLLEREARRWVWAQWSERRPPESIDFGPTEWLITNRVEEIEGFQPAHDCVACRAGNDQVRAFLRENPGRFVALANLRYEEVWLD